MRMRLMKTATLILAIQAAFLCYSPVFAGEHANPEQWKDAFSRRNYQLGMTLEEFKAQQFPDLQFDVEAFSVCSNELGEDSSTYWHSAVHGELKRTGVVKCHYYFHHPLLQRLSSAQLVAADWGLPTDFYFIQPEDSDSYFLYRIVSTSKAPIFSELSTAYVAGFGKPNAIAESVLSNRFGAKFKNVILKWENEVSYMNLEQYYEDADTLGIVLGLKPLEAIEKKRLKQVAEERSKRL